LKEKREEIEFTADWQMEDGAKDFRQATQRFESQPVLHKQKDFLGRAPPK